MEDLGVGPGISKEDNSKPARPWENEHPIANRDITERTTPLPTTRDLNILWQFETCPSLKTQAARGVSLS